MFSNLLMFSSKDQSIFFLFYILQNDLIQGDLLLVRIIPDEEGKFGFNLKVNQLSFNYFKMLYGKNVFYFLIIFLLT